LRNKKEKINPKKFQVKKMKKFMKNNFLKKWWKNICFSFLSDDNPGRKEFESFRFS